MPAFSDMLYGRIELPDWIVPFVKIPEFVRLRGVRLSNVDSYEFKDFSSATRWEHGIGVAYLASICAKEKGLNPEDTIKLMLAALLHDVATPPFAHTLEYILEDYDHEIETTKILGEVPSKNTEPWIPVFKSALPKFRQECRKLSKSLKIAIDPDAISELVIGEGDLGYLVSGNIDLDNADNVVRGCAIMGIDVDKTIPIRISQWLATKESIPVDLEDEENEAVKKWLKYRKEYYGAFFSSSSEELGRQAFLQHLIRRSINAGLPRRVCIWNTDDGLMNAMSTIDDTPQSGWDTLSSLVERYILLETTNHFTCVDIFNESILQKLQNPLAAEWIEYKLSSEYLESFVSVVARRGGNYNSNDLLPSPVGKINVYKLGRDLSWDVLPDWMKEDIPKKIRGNKLRNKVAELIASNFDVWACEQPWFKQTPKRNIRVVNNLESVGDWSFRSSKNQTMHSYPGTFVHALPATLLSVLGLKGEDILDPFGGTGQTAVEVIKAGGSVITADNSYIATLTARAKLTYLDNSRRNYIKKINNKMILDHGSSGIPDFELRDKWHHKDTLKELTCIKNYISNSEDLIVKDFLLASFSAILTQTTGRKGKEHGWFADNTPLGKTENEPPYQNAINYFLKKLKTNLGIVERLYASIEASDRHPKKALSRAKVIQHDATDINIEGYGITENSIRGIITSPPYLCMADYTLGQRLSYYWLNPDGLQEDFAREIAPRRRRFSPTKVAEEYFSKMEQFFINSNKLLIQDGYLCIVLGEPSAKSFSESEVFKKINDLAVKTNFTEVWSTWRPINWHRNQGYQKLRKEKILIFSKNA